MSQYLARDGVVSEQVSPDVFVRRTRSGFSVELNGAARYAESAAAS